MEIAAISEKILAELRTRLCRALFRFFGCASVTEPPRMKALLLTPNNTHSVIYGCVQLIYVSQGLGEKMPSIKPDGSRLVTGPHNSNSVLPSNRKYSLPSIVSKVMVKFS